MKRWEIWMEGYAATGESGHAQLVNDGRDGRPDLIEAETFDAAVQKYMELRPEHGIVENDRSRYISEEYYNKRRSNWNIWACDLFPTKKEAAKSFG